MAKKSPSQSFEFCVAILPEVSRTFAINIRVLTGDLHKAVLCAYLFCRIVDTIEDSEQLTLDRRNQLLDEYRDIFAHKDYSKWRFENFVSLFGEIDKPNPEHRLVQNVASVFDSFLSLPDFERAAIENCVIEMTDGMKLTVNRQSELVAKLHTLSTMADLEQYCHFVAGTVGIMLTKLFIHHTKAMNPEQVKRATELQGAFALGLQLTNIIKDCYSDYRRGWCYVPVELADEFGVTIGDLLDPACQSRSLQALNKLIIKAARHLDDALAYTLLIPRRETRMRLFNLWSLFFAIRTLKKAWGNGVLLTGEYKIKISRPEVYFTLIQTVICSPSNALLRRAYGKIRAGIPEA